MIELNHLLIIACSQTKRPDAGLLPALLRYNGTAYRVLNNWIDAGGRIRSDDLTVYIVSGRYGLISHSVPIEHYNQPLTPTFAAALRPAIGRLFDQLAVRGQVRIELSALYQTALPLCLPWPAERATGGIGQRLAGLKQWLYRLPLVERAREVGG